MFSMFLVDFFIYLFLGFYFENVLPQDFGTPKPFYFLFTKKYWCKEEIQSNNRVNIDLHESKFKKIKFDRH